MLNPVKNRKITCFKDSPSESFLPKGLEIEQKATSSLSLANKLS
jgi:hypothetical protein